MGGLFAGVHCRIHRFGLGDLMHCLHLRSHAEATKSEGALQHARTEETWSYSFVREARQGTCMHGSVAAARLQQNAILINVQQSYKYADTRASLHSWHLISHSGLNTKLS